MSPADVERMDFGDDHSTTIELFTSDLCDAFPTLKTFYAKGLKMKKIDANAFKSCTDLRYFHFDNNNLSDLNYTMFDNAKMLQGVVLKNNQIKHIHPKLLYDKQWLIFLDLSNNLLTELPLDDMINLRGVQILTLHSNQFEDLDEVKLHQIFPGITSLNMCPNDKLSRTRIEQMDEYFKSKRVSFNANKCTQMQGSNEEHV